MRTLLVICARKGSKRLPGKHLKEVNGQPMWEYAAYSCAAYVAGDPAHAYAVFSTDDPAIIKEVGERRMVSLRPRPPHLSRDSTPIHEVLQDAFGPFAGALSWAPQAVAFIPANIPTVTPDLIEKCVRKLQRDGKLSSVITVRTVRDLPEWMWERGPAGELEPALRQHTGAYRMQDLPTRYVATGTVNVVRTEVLMACKDPAAFRWLGGRIGYVLDEDAIEVHDAADLERARAWMHWKQLQREGKK